MLGGRVERYQVTSKLGEGGMSEVWLGVDDEGRRVAIKLLTAQNAGDSELAARFRREAEATRRLRHPNIVALEAVGQLPDGRVYLVMEHADGPSLDQLLSERGWLPLAQVLPLLRQLADAIDHAHEQGVVHRDLKPENLILVDGGASLKVLDFGIAKIIASDHETLGLTRDGDVFGSAQYMSPEQWIGQGRDPRIDIYAFGCVAYDLVTGQPPFSGRTMELMRSHLHEEPTPPSVRRPELGLPPELDALVLRCLAKDAAARYQRGREVCAALDRLTATLRPARLRDVNPTLLRQLGEALLSAGETDLYLRAAVERAAEIERALGASPESPALARELDAVSQRLRARLPELIPRWAHLAHVMALFDRVR